MAVEKFWNAGIFFDGRNYTGQSNTVSITRSMSLLDTSVFGVETRIYAGGQAEEAISVSGWWNVDEAANSQAIDPNLFNALSNGTQGALLLYAKAGDGEPAFFWPGTMGTFNFFGTFGELAPFSADFNYSQWSTAGTRVPPCRGLVGLPLGAYASASGNGTVTQITPAATASESLVMTVHLISTNATNVTFELESDDAVGFPSATSRITSGALTQGGSYIGSLQGPLTDTYFRIKYTRSGGTTFTAVAAFGKA